ncbi:class I adenylate-forming enzyme family protein [Actinomadura formosensis]|uniref:class I adenylate-forming enzyme family protein n=1 Tax=Actinomadura formosensis TaxID=60706 RepID=UPI00083443D1|nr:AMP-binding protein [Actinomadura formosensis]
MSPTTRELIVRGARQHADRIAVVFGDRQLTFAQVDELSNRLARALAEVGGTHRRRVGLLVNNSLLSVPVDFACVKAGINRVPLNARLSAAEHTAMLTDTACEVVVFGADLTDRARELAAALPGVAFVGLETSLGTEPTLMERAAKAPATLPEVAVEPDDVILTLFTSGTTGTLKAAQHTQASYAGICRNVLLNLLPATREDVMLHAASLIHASGVFVLPLWLRGGRTVILPGFSPDPFLRAIAAHGATAINLVPTMIQMLVEEPSFTTTDVSTLQRVIYGASPMPRPVIERAMDLWGRERFWQYYGQTEIPLCIAVLRPEDHAGDRLAACGQLAADIELRLLDDQGREVADGEAGEIVVRGPSATAGYFNAPELTAQTYRDGWIHTRDVGVLDEHGFLFLKDRTSDMIISGGYNVYPREVEDALLTHPAVREAAVVGTPDPRWVEAVTAVIVPAGGATGDDALRAELTAHVTAQIASYKKPRRIVFRDAVPKTAVGKLDRKRLRADLADR